MLSRFIGDGMYVHSHVSTGGNNVTEAFCGLFSDENIDSSASRHRGIYGVFSLNQELLRLFPVSRTVQLGCVNNARGAFSKGRVKIQIHGSYPTY